MRRPAASSKERAAQPRMELALWTGMVGPPLIWLTQLEIKYTLIRSGTEIMRAVLLSVAVLALALVVACGVMSLRNWRLSDASPLDEWAGTTERIRFMAAIGMLTATMFGLIIVAQALADIIIPTGKS